MDLRLAILSLIIFLCIAAQCTGYNMVQATGLIIR